MGKSRAYHPTRIISFLAAVVTLLIVIHWIISSHHSKEPAIFSRSQCEATNYLPSATTFSSVPVPPLRPQLDNHVMDFYRPYCFKKWIDKDIKFVSELMHKNILYDKLLGINSTSYGNVAYCKYSSLIVGLESPRIHFLHHIPHFSEVYFNFLSIVIWQRDVFKIPSHNTPCIHSLQIDDSAKQFWDMTKESHNWIYNLVSKIEKHWGVSTIAAKSCTNDRNRMTLSYDNEIMEYDHGPNPHYDVSDWFLHPSDPYLIGSLLLHTDPCVSYGKGNELIDRKAPLNIVVLNRKIDRKLLNEKEINDLFQSNDPFINYNFSFYYGLGRYVQSLRATPSNTLFNLTIPMDSDEFIPTSATSSSAGAVYHQQPSRIGYIQFEKTHFMDQIITMRSADIVITVHGAGETNVAWMKPCSILIELFPFGFYFPEYFGSLAQKSGVLHYSWQVPRNHTEHRQNYKRRPECKSIIQDYYDAMTSDNGRSNGNNRRNSELSYKKYQYLRNGRKGFRFGRQALENQTSTLDQLVTENKKKKKSFRHLGTVDSTATSSNSYIYQDHLDDFTSDKTVQLIMKQCFKDAVCRSCVRGADGIHVDIQKLYKVIEKALVDRKKCVLDHPLYNVAPSKGYSNANLGLFHSNLGSYEHNKINGNTMGGSNSLSAKKKNTALFTLNDIYR